MNIRISNPDYAESVIEKFKTDGPGQLHILSDFDRTLTYGTIDGKKTPSIISLLRNGNYLSKTYAKEAHALFEKYHPIEIDDSVSVADKKAAMTEWWTKHHEVMIRHGLSLNDLQTVANTEYLKFRNGVTETFRTLHEQNIPVIIMSASGCGEIIPLFFKKNNVDYSNITYIVNAFEWDENGKAIDVKQPVIHSLNKDETILSEIPHAYEIVKNRKNVILLGDGIGDVGMIDGFEYDNLLKIGFLNTDYVKNKNIFTEHFDVVIEGDGDFEYVKNLIHSIV